jgi:hypothetical protein
MVHADIIADKTKYQAYLDAATPETLQYEDLDFRYHHYEALGRISSGVFKALPTAAVSLGLSA